MKETKRCGWRTKFPLNSSSSDRRRLDVPRGLGAATVLERRRRRASQQTIDELFEENGLDELWGDTPLRQSSQRLAQELVEV